MTKLRVQGILKVAFMWKTSCERVMIWKLLWTLQAYKQLCMHMKYITIYAATTLTACSSRFVAACCDMFYMHAQLLVCLVLALCSMQLYNSGKQEFP